VSSPNITTPTQNLLKRLTSDPTESQSLFMKHHSQRVLRSVINLAASAGGFQILAGNSGLCAAEQLSAAA